MSTEGVRRYHAGDSLEDLCRACKMVRAHTVMVADSNGAALRVICDYCGSQHNFRGGEIKEALAKPPSEHSPRTAAPLVTERERSSPVANMAPGGNNVDLELLLRRIIREENGLTPVRIAEK